MNHKNPLSMKQFSLILLASVAFAFVGCDKFNPTSVGNNEISAILTSDLNEVNEDQLPSGVTGYVESNFYPIGIETAYSVSEGILTELQNGEELYFDLSGEYLGDGEDADECRKGEGDEGGKRPKGPKPPREPRPKHDPFANDSLLIEYSSLPTAVQDSVSESTVEAIAKVINREGDVLYIIKFTDGSIGAYDADGNKLEKRPMGDKHRPGMMMDVNDLPDFVTDYVDTNYSGETVVMAFKRRTGEIFIKLSNDVKVVFDADGNVIHDSGE